MGMTPQRLLCTLKGSGSGSLRSTPYCVLIQESSLMWVLHTTFPLLDFQKSPSSDFIWRGTKDFSHLIGASFTDGKTGRCAWTNQSSSQEPLGIELSLTRTKRIETWIAVQIPTWGRLRKRWKMLLRPRAILNCVTIKGKKLKYICREGCFCVCSKRSWQESKSRTRKWNLKPQMRVTPLPIFGAKCKWKPFQRDKSTSRSLCQALRSYSANVLKRAKRK